MSLASLWACGCDGLGRSELRFLPVQEGAQGAVGTVQRVGRQTQCRRSPAGAGPFRHVGANLAEHLQGREAVHAVDPGQVHPGHPIQVCPDVEARRVALTPPGSQFSPFSSCRWYTIPPPQWNILSPPLTHDQGSDKSLPVDYLTFTHHTDA